MMDGLPFVAWPGGEQVLSILIYHRVLATPDPMRPGEIDLARFERQMAFIARHFEVLPLIDAAAALRANRLRRRTCCVTFDDGYADNLTVALPVLERYSIAATVFVATDFLDGGRMFNDTVIDTIGACERDSLDLSADGLGRFELRDLYQRRAAVDAILGKAKYLEPAQRKQLVDVLVRAAGVDSPSTGLMLSSAQLRELDSRGVEIGGHTAGHTILTTLKEEDAWRQIEGGKKRLEEILGKSLRTFAYPNGKPGVDYLSVHAEMLAEMGWSVAVTTAHGVATSDTDPYQLPRFTPWAHRLGAFAAQLVRNARLRGPAGICSPSFA